MRNIGNFRVFFDYPAGFLGAFEIAANDLLRRGAAHFLGPVNIGERVGTGIPAGKETAGTEMSFEFFQRVARLLQLNRDGFMRLNKTKIFLDDAERLA